MELQEVLLVFETDKQHSFSSRNLIGVVTSKDDAITIVKLHCKKVDTKLKKSDVFNLVNYNQTQGHKSISEYDLELVETNVLL